MPRGTKGMPDRFSRRDFVKSATVAGVTVGLGGTINTATAQEWPDLSGQEVHVLSSESSVPFQEYWSRVANDFQEATGASVRLEYGGIGIGYRERISQLLAAGDPPEVSHLGMNDAATYAEAGQLADHTEVVDHWEDVWSETPGDMRVDLGDGDIYVPMLSNPHTTWYREDVVDDPPETWDEEVELAEEMDEGEGETRATVIPLQEGFAGQNKFLSYGWSNGAQVCETTDDGDVEVVMHTDYLDEWVEVVEHYQQLEPYSLVGEDVGTSEYIASVANEFSYWNQYVGARSKLAGEGTPVGGDIAPAHPPYNGHEQLYGNVQGHAVFEGSENPDAGREFLRFMAEPENLMGFYFADPVHNAPVHDAVHDHELFQQNLEELPDYWDIPDHLNFDWIPSGIDMANELEGINPHAGTLLNSFELFHVNRDVFVGDESPEDAITQRAENLQQIIDDS